jgi:hypothetical protein
VHEYEREVHILQARIKERLASEDVDFLDIPEGVGEDFNKYIFLCVKQSNFSSPKRDTNKFCATATSPKRSS